MPTLHVVVTDPDNYHLHFVDDATEAWRRAITVNHFTVPFSVNGSYTQPCPLSSDCAAPQAESAFPIHVSYKGLAAPLRATACANEPLVLSLSQENSSLTSELLLPPGCQMRTQKPWSKTVSNDPKPPTCTVSGEHVCCFKSLGYGGYWFLQQSSKWQSQDPNLSRCNLNTIKFTCFSVQINDFTIWYGAAIVTI